MSMATAAPPPAVLTTLFAVRVALPLVLLAISLSLFTLKAHATIPQRTPIIAVTVEVKTPRRSLILSLLSLIALTYFLDGFALILHSVLSRQWQGTPSYLWSGLEVEALGGLLATGLLAIIGTVKEMSGVDVWSTKRPKFWAVIAVAGTLVEVILLGLSLRFIHKDPVSIPELPPVSQARIPNLLHSIFPVIRLLLLVPLYPTLANPLVRYRPAAGAGANEDEIISVQPCVTERSSLLFQDEDVARPSQGIIPPSVGRQYGTFAARSIQSTSDAIPCTDSPPPNDGQDTTRPVKPLAANAQKNQSDSVTKWDNPTWGELYKRLNRIAPYLWPKTSVWLQFLAFICILVLLIGRIVNVAVPLTLGELLIILETKYGGGSPSPSPTSFWPYLWAYVGLRYLQSSGGLSALRDTLWAPVLQYSDREMSQMTFTHLLSLSLSFHTKRKTGEILRILDRGAAINRVFELLLFNICPTFVDIIIALGVFVWKFGWELALVIAFVMVSYIVASITLTTWRAQIRREMNDRDVITRGIHTDCLLNYETVKYFGGESFEGERYRAAIQDYQSLEYRVIVSLSLLNLVQSLLTTLGLLVGGTIVALRVTRGQSPPSYFVVFITYLAQLYGPLFQLGYMYRSLNTSLVDTERLLLLLEEPTEVNDKPGAPDLIVNDGEIEFENVSFSYDNRTTALKNVSFTVPKGSSVALVGESGSGKSTILRLLYRFYDLKEGEGRILIDGKDIRDVTQLSLRKAIGVVPQDSVLFNASIGYNIGYGKLGASDDEIVAAAQAAQMHDRIMSFPDGYETKVGERGVRLSGGEKQRVAIARTLLKNPPILLLDEATSALDTSTEKDIQKALQNLVRGRSSLSIAHRLSTIASADLILVLKDGQIVEKGSHRELIEQDGIFAAMWSDQISADEPNEAVFTERNKKKEESGYDAEGSIASSTNVKQQQKHVEQEQEEVSKHSLRSPDFEGEPDLVLRSKTAVDDTTTTHKVAPAGEAVPLEAQQDQASYAAVAASSPDADAPVVAAPVPISPSTAPIAFPTTDEPETQSGRGSMAEARSPPPAVTFDAGVEFPPSAGSRSATPDPNADGKRKRTASQNLQRFARRVSLVARRTGSSTSIPVAKKDDQPGSSKDNGSIRGEGASGSARAESPASSIRGSEDGRKSANVKEKEKEKRKKRFSK